MCMSVYLLEKKLNQYVDASSNNISVLYFDAIEPSKVKCDLNKTNVKLKKAVLLNTIPI